jgi:REP element-mobilizing transposase RayT
MTRYDPEKHHRRSIRLRGYDYARPGAYFVTICTRERECLFGDAANGAMNLNEYGKIAYEEWIRSATIRHEIRLDEFIVMPNHLHGIVILTDGRGSHSVGATGRSPLQPAHEPQTFRPGPPKNSLGSFIAGFKSATTQRINRIRGTPGMSLWQRNYYEHVIRNEDELNQIRTYISENPLKWELDENHPNRLPAPDRG